MKSRPLIPFLIIACSTLGCGAEPPTGSSSGAPSPEPPPDPPPEEPPPAPAEPSVPTALVIDGHAVVTLSPGEERSLTVTVLDDDASPLDIEPDLQWTSGPSAAATVDEDGIVRAGVQLGQSWVFVEALDPPGLRDSVSVWIQRPESEASDFDITIHYADADRVPEWWPRALESAAERWERVVRARLPEVDVAELTDFCEYHQEPPPEIREGTEDGVRVYVQVSEAFPPGTYVGAVGGTCIHRSLPHPTTVLGVLILNHDHFDAGPPEDLAYLAHHELGHVLGLVGNIQGPQPEWFDPFTETYRGHLGLFGYSLDKGREVPELPIRGSHWPFGALMGNLRSNDISNTTAGALMDLGYPAAWYGTGPID